MPRLNVLSKIEIQNYEKLPDLSEKDWDEIIDKLRNNDVFLNLRVPVTKIIFILQYGYFRKSHRFFSITDFKKEDIKYISILFNLTLSSIQSEINKKNELNTKHLFWKQRSVILKELGYQSYRDHKQIIQKEIHFYINKRLKPKNIFEQVILFLRKQKIELPSYDSLQKEITNGLNDFEDQLSKQIKLHLDNDIRQLLDQLLDEIIKEDQHFKTGVKTSVLTQLKTPNQSIKFGKISESIENFKTVSEIFKALLPIMDKLNFSPEVIAYHASWTIKARLFQIQQFPSVEKRYLHLLSFISHQYKLRQDNFVDVFLNAVKNYQNFIEKEKREMILASLIEKDTVKKLSTSRNHYKEICEQMIAIADSLLPDNEKFQEFMQLAEKIKSHRKKQEIELDEIAQEVENKLSSEELYYSLLEKHHRKLLGKVSSIIEQLEFDPEVSDPNLIDVINFYKENNGDLSKLNDITFLDDKEQEYVLDLNGNIKNALCKVLLMFKIESALKSGTLNLKYSYKYLSFEAYLFSKSEWAENKAEFLNKADMEHLKDSVTVLNELKEKLDEAYHKTNSTFNQGKNSYLKLDRNKKPIVSTPADEQKPKECIISDLLPSERYFSLQQILHQVNDSVKFLDNFEHFSIKRQTGRPGNNTFLAIIMALGCNIGIRKISRISKGISADTLENTRTWYFTIESLNNANAQIISAINQLSLPRLYLTKDGEIHTSSDGQKFGVKPESLNSNYSFKYFGKERGVSVYTFLDQRSSIFSTNVINSSSRESTFVLDGLCFSNEVVSTMHSTDTHGYTEVIFGMMDLLNINFAPRIKNVGDQTLYSFEKIKSYEKKDYQILPDKYIRTDMINEHWDDILRIMVSIKLQKCTASQILKRLNSYSKQNPLHKALKEYGRILKSIFILHYLDDLDLRKAIEKQLNLIEHAHRFARFVFFDNGQEYDEPTKEGQEIIAGCKQLIQNCIILWNYMKLTQIYDRCTSAEERKRIIAAFKLSSIISWSHVNLNGEYDFNRDEIFGEELNLEKLKKVKILEMS